MTNPFLAVTRFEMLEALGGGDDENVLPPVNPALLEMGRSWVNHQDTLPEDEREWNQEDWVAEESCGTAYCFAGYVAHQIAGDGLNTKSQCVVLADGKSIHVSDFAQYWLGLSDDQADDLFEADNTAEQINDIVDRLMGA